MEIEVRRSGRLVASISPAIAPQPGSLGVEILSSEDPLPLLAVAVGLCLLRAEGKGSAAAEAPPGPAGAAASGSSA
jgi:hypothetical protein